MGEGPLRSGKTRASAPGTLASADELNWAASADLAAGSPPDPARAARPGAAWPGPAAPGAPQLAQVARGSTLNLVGAAVSAGATVGVTVLVTQEFAKPLAGAFFTAISAWLIVEAVASLGSNVGLVYFIARLRSLGQARRIPAIMRAAVIPVIMVSLLATACMLLFAGPLAHVLLSGQLGKSHVHPSAVAQSLRLLGLTLPFAALEDTFLGGTRGYRDMRPTVVVDKTGRSLLQLVGIAIAVGAGSSALLAPLWALPYIPAAAVAWLWLRRIRRRPDRRRAALPDVPPELAALLALATPVLPAAGGPPAHPAPGGGGHAAPRTGSGRVAERQLANANPRGFWRFTTPRAVASLASITLQRIDIVLVAILRGPGEAAVYTAATRFLVAGQLGNMAISMAAQPRLTELFATSDLRNANVVYRVTTAWLILLTWPLYLLAVIYGPQFLTIFGHSYNAGAAVMVILGLTMLFSAACGQVDIVLITTGRSSWSLVNGLLAVGVNVGADLMLIPRYGITGAAIGWAIAIVVSNLMPLAQLAAVLRLHPVGRGTLTACALCALSFGAVPLAIRALAGSGALPIAGAVAAGCLVQAAGLWRFRRALSLSAMPGVSLIRARRRRRSLARSS